MNLPVYSSLICLSLGLCYADETLSKQVIHIEPTLVESAIRFPPVEVIERSKGFDVLLLEITAREFQRIESEVLKECQEGTEE